MDQLGEQPVPTPGHSPDHCAIQLASQGLTHQPVQVYRPGWNSRFCEDPASARESRRWLLEYSAEHEVLVLPAHFAGSHAGYVARHGDRFGWRFA